MAFYFLKIISYSVHLLIPTFTLYVMNLYNDLRVFLFTLRIFKYFICFIRVIFETFKSINVTVTYIIKCYGFNDMRIGPLSGNFIAKSKQTTFAFILKWFSSYFTKKIFISQYLNCNTANSLHDSFFCSFDRLLFLLFCPLISFGTFNVFHLIHKSITSRCILEIKVSKS